MHIELTEQERLCARQGEPVHVVDPETREAYVLIARERFDQVRSHLAPCPRPGSGTVPGDRPEAGEKAIPEGIRLAQQAYRRDLPDLLREKNLCHQWVAYHRQQRIGIAPHGRTLLEECAKRGLPDDQVFVGWIDPCGLAEEEEVTPRPQHYVGSSCSPFSGDSGYGSHPQLRDPGTTSRPLGWPSP